ncbi:hypothetical protein Tco_0322261 [Tanacetum coccineum]
MEFIVTVSSPESVLEVFIAELSTGDTLTSDRSFNKYSTLADGRIGHRSLGVGSGSSLTEAPQGEELGLMKPLSGSTSWGFLQSRINDQIVALEAFRAQGPSLFLLAVSSDFLVLSGPDVQLKANPSVDLLVHEFSDELKWQSCILFWHSCHTTLPLIESASTDIFSRFAISSRNI